MTVVDEPDAPSDEVEPDAPGAQRPLVRSDTPWYRPGLTILLFGLALWSVAIAIAAVTKDDILMPTVILSGSFVIPLAVVVSIAQRDAADGDSALPVSVMVAGFLGGGTLGVLLAALLESYVMPSRTGTFIVVGLVEESCKGLIILVLARRLRSRTARDGMVLGAVVGAGFAAFETAGYAFNAYTSSLSKQPLLNLVQTELNRGLASPFGHILWSSLLGGALFAAAARRGRVCLKGVGGTFVGVVALHTLWDQTHGWAIILTDGFTGAGWHMEWPDEASWVISPTHAQHELFSILYNAPLLVISLIGSLWFYERWQRSRTAGGPGARRGSAHSRDVDLGELPHAGL